MIHTDFESRSRVNLLTDGGYNYWTDPSTQATMMAFAFGDEEPEIWIPLGGEFWDKLRAALTERGHCVHEMFPKSYAYAVHYGQKIAAHNAQFERLGFWYFVSPVFDVPEFPIESFYCTATQARANNLPGDLGGCAQALGVKQLKNRRGSELIKMLCIPREDGTFLEDLDLYIEFAEYCLQDVRAERAIHKAMRPLTDNELEDYQVSEIINDRGLRVDLDFARRAVEYADAEQADLLDIIVRLTNGAVTKARGKNLLNWVYDRLPELQQHHMHKYKDGERKYTLDRNARERLLTDTGTPSLVRQVVEASDFAQASSTGKYRAMINRADPDDHRVRGSYILNGASSTGRYSSRGLQTHNMPRDKHDDPDAVRELFMQGAPSEVIARKSGYSVMQALKRLLRHSIVAEPGHTFVCGDWGQIEGRGLPWLANTPLADEKLRQYETQTAEYDVYCRAAESIFRQKVRRDGGDNMEVFRQVGKVSELSLQFGGGKGAFQAMAGNYGVSVSNEEAEHIKIAWRKANPWASIYWKELHKAAVLALRNPMTEHKAGRVSYCYQPNALKGVLWCRLPSGRLLAYPEVRLTHEDGPYGPQWEITALKANWKPKADEPEWPRIALWPGLMAENVDQAMCGDILRDALAELVLEYDAPVVGHTHDEILLEVPIPEAAKWRQILHDVMVAGSEWSTGLPLDVDIWVGPNFKK